MATTHPEAKLSIRRSRRHGALICATTSVLALAFLYGLWQGSYWALAIPVTVGVMTVLWLMFWIGYTISTINGIPPEADHYSSSTARHIAQGICAVSVVLSILFVLAVAYQSYWALAIPVAAAVLSILAMVFWIGWAIVRQKTTLRATSTDSSLSPTGEHSA